MKNFKVGQKVVCIDSEGSGGVLIKNKIYEIEKLTKSKCCGVDLLLLKDLSYSGHLQTTTCFRHNHDHGFLAFGSLRFKPLQYENISLEIVSNLKLVEEKSDVQIKELEKHD